MKFYGFLALIILLCFSKAASSAERTGHHYFYFEDRNGKLVEVNFIGTYEVSGLLHLPKKGGFTFKTSCGTKYSRCNIDYGSKLVTEDFINAVKTNRLFTITFGDWLPCEPGQICREPNKSRPPARESVNSSESIGTQLKAWIDAGGGVIDIFEKLSQNLQSPNTITFQFYFNRSDEKRPDSICQVEDTTCQEVVKFTHHNDGSFSAAVESGGDPEGFALRNFLDSDMMARFECTKTQICKSGPFGKICFENYVCFIP